jgi:hypothetical protein
MSDSGSTGRLGSGASLEHLWAATRAGRVVAPVNLTVSFALTPKERWQSLRTWSYVGILRDSVVGLPVAGAGVGLVIWRAGPGAASGWGVILTVLGVGILAFPHITLIRGLISANRRARSAPERVDVTLTDTCLKYAREGYSAEFGWRNVTDVRAAASCWIISTRLGSTAIVVPMRAVPAASEPEVTEFLRQWRDRTSSGRAAG